MFKVRLHGRGGQGVVTAAEMLAVAGFYSDVYSQSFPSFGSERMGAPIMAFCRFDEHPIRVREPVIDPNVLWVQDDSLMHEPSLFHGLKNNGTILVNSRKSAADLGLLERLQQEEKLKFIQLPATELGREYLGRPVPNAAMLGAFTAIYTAISIESVEKALHERFPFKIASSNYQAALAGREWIQKMDIKQKGEGHVDTN